MDADAPRARRRIAVFCGSNAGADPAFAAAAVALGQAIARDGHTLVYGGSRLGLMGQLADAAIAEGGEVIGVMPQALVDRERAHRGLSELRVVTTMHERKATMAELSDAFVALPGGIGTLDELFEIWTWRQLGFHGKPLVLFDVADYFAPLIDFLDRSVAAGFLRAEGRGMLRQATSATGVVGMLA
ncbi:MAG: TIGR00730 family Rossman fold protein [Gemmatimonadaceae bacterium]|nr:TIGR00730 family Rossman fold protein [Gemmatimonadaceae bacterium]